jgi:hypothetical protein
MAIIELGDAGGSDVIWTMSANLEQDDYTTVSTTLQADGADTAPDSWALAKPTGSASVVVGAGHTVTFVPDSPGVYTLAANVGTEVVVRVVKIGIEIEGGAWAEVLVDMDLPTIGGLGTVVLDDSGDADYTVGGITLHCSTQTAADTFECNPNGIEVTKTGSQGKVRITLGITDDFDVDPEDIVYFIVEADPDTSSGANDLIRVVTPTGEEVASGANSLGWIEAHHADGAGDWDIYDQPGSIGVGAKAADLVGATPARLRFVFKVDRCTGTARLDTTDSAVARPSDVTLRTAFEVTQGTNHVYGAPPTLYDFQSNSYHGLIYINVEDTLYITRIALWRIRPTA